MPTAAKLVAGLLMAALGFIVSETIKPLVEETTDFGYFSWVNAGLGLLCGWIVIGGRAGHGYGAGISNGLTGVAALVFWGLFVQGANEMVRLSLRNTYGGFMDAIAAVFELMAEFSVVLLDTTVIGMLVGGAVVIGLIAEMVSHNWR